MHSTITYDFVLLIPCFNNVDGLMKSLDSVQYNGSYKILVVDDGSEEEVQHSLPASYHTKQPLQITRLTHNQGIAVALNFGLKYIQQHYHTEYIARLDCGDICHPLRFEKQITFLNNNPAVGLLGTWCIFKNDVTGAEYTYTTPLVHADIVHEMHFRNVFIHPTIMFRHEIIKNKNIFYPEDYKYAEDYAFCWIILKSSTGAVLDEFLVTCEINLKSISFKNRGIQLKDRRKVIHSFATAKWLKLLGLVRLSVLSIIPTSFLIKLKSLTGKRKSKQR